LTDLVKSEHIGEILHIRLNRPQKHNAITLDMAKALMDLCSDANRDSGVKVIVLSGAGERAFCAGSDIRLLDEYGDAWSFRNRIEYNDAIRSLTKPALAALKGWVLGGGLELALGCDIRIAAPSARLGCPEVSLGWLGGGGASQMLPRLVGYGQAMKLLLTAQPIDAEIALRIGLIEEIVDEGYELRRALELGAEIAKHNLVPLQTAKAAVRNALSTNLADGLRYENDLCVLSFALGIADAGRDRFAARRTKKNGEPK
jgi:enoyl-CoA hydratase